jgi:hypothetical protein
MARVPLLLSWQMARGPRSWQMARIPRWGRDEISFTTSATPTSTTPNQAAAFPTTGITTAMSCGHGGSPASPSLARTGCFWTTMGTGGVANRSPSLSPSHRQRRLARKTPSSVTASWACWDAYSGDNASTPPRAITLDKTDALFGPVRNARSLGCLAGFVAAHGPARPVTR